MLRRLVPVLLVLAPLSAPAGAAERAGVAAAVRGDVTLARAPVEPRPVVSGEDVLMQDFLRSGERSGMQILLLDETVFTIGPESEIVVDEFVYDPDRGKGEVSATIVKGVFRFVTGKVAKQDPEDMNVALPAGNIGVRGTIVAGRANAVTRASLVVLLGDSAAAASGARRASIEVCNAGRCELVSRPGFGVRIGGPDAPPTEAFPVPADEIEAILRDVSDPEGIRAAAVEGSLELDDGLALSDDEREERIRRTLQKLDALDTLSDRAAQDARMPDVPVATTQPPALPPAGTPDTRTGQTGPGTGGQTPSDGVPPYTGPPNTPNTPKVP